MRIRSEAAHEGTELSERFNGGDGHFREDTGGGRARSGDFKRKARFCLSAFFANLLPSALIQRAWMTDRACSMGCIREFLIVRSFRRNSLQAQIRTAESRNAFMQRSEAL